MIVVIELEPYEDVQDPGDQTGLTEEAFDALHMYLAEIGTIVSIRGNA